MALRGPRRPLQQTTQNNLNSLQAAHRQHLQAVAKGSGAVPSGSSTQKRPPQLPNASPSLSETLPARLHLSGGLGDSPSARESGANSSRSAGSPRGSAGSAGSGSRVQNSIKEARSFSAEAFGRNSSPASPSTATAGLSAVAAEGAGCEARPGSGAESVSSSRTTPRTASSSSRSRRNLAAAAVVDTELPRWRSRDDEDDEEQFATELDELEDLCLALNIRSEERYTPADIDLRPLTGGTSASASTTAPGGSSKDFEVASLDLEESASEVPRDSDNPFDTLRGGQRASYELQQCGSLPHGCRIEKADGVSAQYFFHVDAAEGPYAPATLTFWIKIFDEFPALDGVSIRATKRILHPNIDQETGRLKVPHPVAGSESACRLKDLLIAIRGLVVSPTDSPAVNADAAMLLQTDPEEFRRVVRSTLGGGEYRGARFDRVLEFGKKRVSAADSAGEKQRQISDQMRVDLMKLDVLQSQLKALADTMIEGNNVECRDLEASKDP